MEGQLFDLKKKVTKSNHVAKTFVRIWPRQLKDGTFSSTLYHTSSKVQPNNNNMIVAHDKAFEQEGSRLNVGLDNVGREPRGSHPPWRQNTPWAEAPGTCHWPRRCSEWHLWTWGGKYKTFGWSTVVNRAAQIILNTTYNIYYLFCLSEQKLQW